MEPSEQTKVDILSRMPTELSEIVIRYLMEDDQSHLFLSECCLVSKSWHQKRFLAKFGVNVSGLAKFGVNKSWEVEIWGLSERLDREKEGAIARHISIVQHILSTPPGQIISFSRIWFKIGESFGIKINVLLNDSNSQEQTSLSTKSQFYQLKCRSEGYWKNIEEYCLDVKRHTEGNDNLLSLDTMEYDSGFIVFAELSSVSDIHLIRMETNDHIKLNPEYPAGHVLQSIIVKEGHLGVFSVPDHFGQGNLDMRIVIYTIDMKKVTEVKASPVEFKLNREVYKPGSAQIFDFSVKHDVIATACSTNDDPPRPQVAIHKLSDGEKLWTIDVNPDEVFWMVKLAFDPTGRYNSMFMIWLGEGNIFNLRKLSMPGFSLLGSETIKASRICDEEQLAVSGGLINIFGECKYEPSDLPPPSNIVVGNEFNGTHNYPGGYIHQLCFSTCEGMKSQCITSTVHYLYKDLGYYGEQGLRLLGFGSKFAVYAYTDTPPQCEFTDTYRIVHMPDIDGGEVQCPGRLGTMERLDSETIYEALGEHEWLDGIDGINDPHILLLRLSSPYNEDECANIFVNSLKPLGHEHAPGMHFSS